MYEHTYIHTLYRHAQALRMVYIQWWLRLLLDLHPAVACELTELSHCKRQHCKGTCKCTRHVKVGTCGMYPLAAETRGEKRRLRRSAVIKDKGEVYWASLWSGPWEAGKADCRQQADLEQVCSQLSSLCSWEACC